VPLPSPPSSPSSTRRSFVKVDERWLQLVLSACRRGPPRPALVLSSLRADHGGPHDRAERVDDAPETLYVVRCRPRPRPPLMLTADADAEVMVSARRVRSPSMYSKPWSARNESGPSGGSIVVRSSCPNAIARATSGSKRARPFCNLEDRSA